MDHKGLLALRAKQGQPGHGGPLAQKVKLEKAVCKDYLVKKVKKVNLDPRVKQVPQVRKDPQGRKDPREFRVLKDQEGLKGPLEPKVIPVHKALRGIEDLEVKPGLLVHKAQQVSRVKQVLKALKEIEGHEARPDPLGLRDKDSKARSLPLSFAWIQNIGCAKISIPICTAITAITA